jgi:hypothetical protein
VNIRCPLLYGVKQHFIYKLYYRGVISELREVGFFELFFNFEFGNVIFG